MNYVLRGHLGVKFHSFVTTRIFPQGILLWNRPIHLSRHQLKHRYKKYTQMKTYKMVLMGILMLSLAEPSYARQQKERGAVRSWAESQQRALSNFSKFEVKANVRHVVKTSNGKRDAQIQIRFSGDPEGAAHRPEVEEFILNGEKLDTSEARRVQQALTSMMSSELGPLLYNFTAPFHFFKRLRGLSGPIEETIDGETLIRFNFVAEGPPNRLGFGEDQRPGRQGQGPPGLRNPNFGPPNGDRRGPPGGGPPVERVSFWFDQSVSKLVMSSSRLMMPGERVLEVQAMYERINGLDLPVWRTVKGRFTMQRRLRTTTAELDHETAYPDYVFSNN